ncbi:MAG TPA: hypothetical protein VGL15_13210 [Vicinamibacteria bacterium]
MTAGGARRYLIASVAAAGLAALPAVARSRGPAAATLNLGPNDADSIAGFQRDYEIDGPVATRWSTYHASVTLPVAVTRGPAELAFRYARMLPQTAQVEVRVAGRRVDRFECRGGRFEVRRVPVPAPLAAPVAVQFDVDSHDRRDLGLRLDWVRLEVGPDGAMRAGISALSRVAVLIFGAFVVFCRSGLRPITALVLTAGLSAVITWGAGHDPIVLAHLALKLALPALLLTVVVAEIVRRAPGGGWVAPIFLGSYLLKGAGVFHPAFFYPDVQNHRRYVFELADAHGGIARRGMAAQMAVNTAYPRYIAGRPYAMPYSPLFFVPFTWLPRDGPLVEDGLRHVGLAAAALQAPLAFAIAASCFGAGAGVGAALLAALVPVYYSRVLLAVWPTLAGHLLDALTIAAALLVVADARRGGRWALLAATATASLMTYVAALFNVTAFFCCLAALERRLAGRLLALLALAGAVTVLWLYGPFVVTFFREILPALARPAAVAGDQGAVAASGLAAALRRIPLFYGYGYPAIAVAGLVVAHRRLPRPLFRVFAAYGLAFLVLVLLRAASGLFKDLKEVEFVAPLVAVLGGATLDTIATATPRGRWAAALVVVGLAAFTAERYFAYFAEYAALVGQVAH